MSLSPKRYHLIGMNTEYLRMEMDADEYADYCKAMEEKRERDEP